MGRSLKLEGKVALVTGAGRSIGKATALLLAEEGASVAVNSFSERNAEITTNEINQAGGRAISVPGDVGVNDDVVKMFEQIKQEFGTIDILVNNAGISPKTRQGAKQYVVEMPIDEWERVVDVNLNGMFYCCQEALKIMLPKKSGCIVNFASLVANVYAEITAAHYMATKAAAIGLTKALAGEVSKDGIRVNAIAPGRINTEMVAAAKKELNDAFLKTIPMDKFGEPREVADAVLYLVSDSSSYVSGIVLPVDGGGVRIG